MNKKYFISILLFFILLSCLNYNIKNIPSAKKGILDLRNWDFEKYGNVSLHGEWEFYWKKLLNPEDFIEKSFTCDGYIRVPGIWNSFKINKKKINGIGYATYRLIILLKKTEDNLSIKISSFPSAYNLYVNNNRIISIGKIGITEKNTVLEARPIMKNFNLNDNKIEIIMQISNFHDVNGGIWIYSPYLGYNNKIIERQNKNIILNIFLFSCFLIICIYHIWLFLLWKKDVSLLFFSLFCFFIGFRLLLTFDECIINNILILPWQILHRSVLFCTYISLALANLFIYFFLKNEYDKKILYIQIICTTILLIILFSTKLIIISYSYIFYIYLLIINLFYIFYVIVISMIHKRYGASILFFGSIFLFYSVFNDALNSNHIINTILLTPFGLFLFILSHSFILSLKFLKAYKQLQNYSHDLEREVKLRTIQLQKATDEKTNFFIKIAHETKTPLTLINNYLNKFINKHGLSKEIQIIKNNINKLTKDMVDFLDIEKLDKGKIVYNNKQIINLNNMLKNIIVIFHEYAKNKNIKINSYFESNIYVKIDPNAIDRIINNLLDNAIKYTNNNGVINITSKCILDKVHIIIEDNGIGMNDSQIKNIFNPFYQVSRDKNNSQGIGIGLSIVKRIIENIKGKILVESKINEGSIFTIIIDRYILKGNDTIKTDFKYTIPFIYTNKTILKDENSNKNYNLLIIEDNIELLSYLIDTMKDRYNIYHSLNGEEALKKIKLIPKPHLIISDIMMDIMDGYEFYDKLSEMDNYKDIPFIFLTAKTSINEKIKGLSKGAIDYISKPFDIKELYTKVNSIISNNKNIKKIITKDVIKKIKSKIKEKQTINFENNCKKYNISKREKEILKLFLEGKINKEISYELKASFHTIRNHIKNIYKKCNVQNKIELFNIFKKGF